MRPVQLGLNRRRSELFFTRLTSCVWFKIGFIIYRYCKNTVNQLWEQLITTHSQVNCWASTCRRKYSSNKGGGSVKSESENDYVSTFTHRLLYPSDELISKSAPKPNCDCLTKVQSACRWRLFQQAEGKLVFETSGHLFWTLTDTRRTFQHAHSLQKRSLPAFILTVALKPSTET